MKLIIFVSFFWVSQAFQGPIYDYQNNDPTMTDDDYNYYNWLGEHGKLGKIDSSYDHYQPYTAEDIVVRRNQRGGWANKPKGPPIYVDSYGRIINPVKPQFRRSSNGDSGNDDFGSGVVIERNVPYNPYGLHDDPLMVDLAGVPVRNKDQIVYLRQPYYIEIVPAGGADGGGGSSTTSRSSTTGGSTATQATTTAKS